MKNKCLILSLAVLAAGVSVLAAASPPAAASWTFTPAVVSQYMFRGVRLSGAAFQPNIELAAGAFTLGMWGSFPLADSPMGRSDAEVDLYAFHTAPISMAASLLTGVTLYTYPSADKNLGFYRWTLEPSVAVSYTVAGVRITPRLCFDTVLDGPTAELAAAYALPLTTLGTELDLSATIGTYIWRNAVENTPAKVKDYGDFWLVQIEVPFQITARSKLTAGFAYTRGSNSFIKQGTQPKSVNPEAVGRGVVTLKYAYAF